MGTYSDDSPCTIDESSKTGGGLSASSTGREAKTICSPVVFITKYQGIHVMRGKIRSLSQAEEVTYYCGIVFRTCLASFRPDNLSDKTQNLQYGRACHINIISSLARTGGRDDCFPRPSGRH